LERIVEQRTKELIEKKMIINEQIRHLEELNNTKDKFFSIVAHDLKSPLYTLKSYASLLHIHFDDLDKEKIISIGHQLHDTVDNTIKMADNLIIWARVQMNEYRTFPQVLDVEELISNIALIYRTIADKKSIALEIDVENLLTILVDKNQAEFIIRNLLNNAIKYTNSGGIIKLQASAQPNQKAKISISDNGIGISEELQKSIFSLVKNQSIPGTHGEKGTGLGLMLCDEFIKLNNGQINVESQEGVGTTFHVIFDQNKPTTPKPPLVQHL
jgi:signal transduction histidine kinase